MKNKNPLVSTIALCYNHSEFLKETLNSIKSQTYNNIELIIMDDFSKDNSVSLIDAWIVENNYKCIFIKHKENKGVCATLNEALTYCHGEYIQLLACDDIYMNNKTEILMNEFLKTNSNVGVVFSDAKVFGGNTPFNGKSFIRDYAKHKKIIGLEMYKDLCIANFIPAMTTIVKKNVYHKIGNYDNELIYEDYDFWLRVSIKYQFLFIDEITAKYRLHENNLHKKIKNNANYVNDYKMLIKHYGNINIDKRLESIIIHLALNDNNENLLSEYFTNINTRGFMFENKIIYYLVKYKFPKFFIRIVIKFNF